MRLWIQFSCVATAFAAAVLGLDSGAAKAVIVNISGIDYDVTTFVASFDDPAVSAKFATPANGGTMPWWGDQTTAIIWSNAVNTALGTPNTVNLFGTNRPSGPRFAWEIFDSSPGNEQVRFASFLPFINGTVSSVTEGPALRTSAEVLPSPSPTSVPGPLPIFGAAAAFGMSRRLRRRIRLVSDSNQG